MPRPYRKRQIERLPRCYSFKPIGISRRNLEQVQLSLDEYEAIRLADYLQLDHAEAAERMGISRPTFTRLIEKARYKISLILVEGKQLNIGGGNIDVRKTRFRCKSCGDFQEQTTQEDLKDCPECGSENLENMMDFFMNEEKQPKQVRKGWGRCKDQKK